MVVAKSSDTLQLGR